MASKDSHTPGLFNIGINLDKQICQSYTSRKEKLYDSVKEENIYLHPVSCNLLALMAFQSDSGISVPRTMLEEFQKKYPKNLNILADLSFICKKVGRERDSKMYEEKLKLLKSDQLLWARSILSQAYALRVGVIFRFDKTSNTLLKDDLRQFTFGEDHTEEVNRIKNLTGDADKVLKTIPKKIAKKNIGVLSIANEKFREGIKMLENMNCSKEEVLSWKYHFARNGFSLVGYIINSEYNNSSLSISEMSKESLQTILDVIQNLELIDDLKEPLKKYLVQSYVGFADMSLLLMSRLNDEDLPQIIKSQDLDSMYHKALSYSPTIECLFQCCCYLYKKKKYSKMIVILDKYISQGLNLDINRSSYLLRGKAYHDYSKELEREESTGKNKEKIFEYLKLAYEDMKQCLDLKYLRTIEYRKFVASKMGLICMKRAVLHESGIEFHCQNIEFIHEAVDILNDAVNEWGIDDDFLIYNYLGECYMYLVEYRKAIESMKIALELSESDIYLKDNFYRLCKAFVLLYTRENDKNLLSEFRFILKEAEKKVDIEWVIATLYGELRHCPMMMVCLIENMIDWDVMGCHEMICVVLWIISSSIQETHLPAILDEANRAYQEVFTKVKSGETNNVCEELRVKFEAKLKEENEESDMNGPTEITKTKTREIFTYDFFVSHSLKDKDWVNSMLRPRLEEFDAKINFKGFIPSRDFVPNVSKLESIIEGIKQSRKLLIVLTPSYLKDNWQKYLSDQMIWSVIKSKMKEKTIIPIILEPCEIPDTLCVFSPINFTKKSDWKRLCVGLTVDVGSAMDLEEEPDRKQLCEGLTPVAGLTMTHRKKSNRKQLCEGLTTDSDTAMTHRKKSKRKQLCEGLTTDAGAALTHRKKSKRKQKRKGLTRQCLCNELTMIMILLFLGCMCLSVFMWQYLFNYS